MLPAKRARASRTRLEGSVWLRRSWLGQRHRSFAALPSPRRSLSSCGSSTWCFCGVCRGEQLGGAQRHADARARARALKG